jgi:hypothetical protein
MGEVSGKAMTPMKTIGGLSVRQEIEARLADQRLETRAAAFDEAIAFLAGSGFDQAARALEHAAFGPQGRAE